jgi:ribosomal protein S18 acetylase RimI-like enzyme
MKTEEKTMIIRKATKRDIGQIVKVYTASAVMNPDDKGNKDLTNYLKYIIPNRMYLALVVEIDNKIVGICTCELGRASKTNADLIDIYVLKEYRSKGIGSAVMKEVYKQLKKKGLKNLGLYSENNPKTINFYKKQGFQIGRLIRRCDKKLD